MASKYHEIEIFTDYLGFTNQTATLLHGLGGSALINECIEKSLAKRLVDQLKITPRNINVVDPTMEDKLKNFIAILDVCKQQLDFIHAYIAYCRLRLINERNNFFIDPNKASPASSVLCIAVRETFHEVSNMEKAIQELSALLPQTNKVKSKRFTSFCALLAGLSGAVCLILHVRKI